MNLAQAVILGVVEGVTEFLPVSSTGHLTIVEKLMGLKVDDEGVTAFTAVIQVGAIIAAIGYFWRDIVKLATAWFGGLFNAERRDAEYRLAWAVIVGSIPIGIIGFLGKDLVSGPLRSVWVVVAALVLFSGVMIWAEAAGRQRRSEQEMTIGDALVIGLAQCIALIPGVSRSGATISAGLFRNFDRVTATRMSFFLSIPALVAAGAYEAVSEAGNISSEVGWGPTIVATIVSFVVALFAIAWLLRLVAHHSIAVFVWYRVALAVVVAGLLIGGVISAT